MTERKPPLVMCPRCKRHGWVGGSRCTLCLCTGECYEDQALKWSTSEEAVRLALADAGDPKENDPS